MEPAGLTNAPPAVALGDLGHRRPDAQASIWPEDHRLLLAHARLKIIDTTDGPNQPSWKQPRELRFVDALPCTANGKLPPSAAEGAALSLLQLGELATSVVDFTEAGYRDVPFRCTIRL